MQNTQRYVIFAYMGFGILLWASLAKLFGALAYAFDLPDRMLLGSNFTTATLLGMVVAICAGIYAIKNEKAYGFSNEVAAELRKVTWPSREETRSATVVVIITTLIIAAILGLYDWVWIGITGLIYSQPGPI